MLGNTTLAPFAVLASQRCTDHTRDAEVGLVEFPHSQQVVNDSLLLGNAVEFGDKPRVEDHGGRIEVRGESVKNQEEQVKQTMFATEGT